MWTASFHHAARADTTDHLSLSPQPLIYSAPTSPMPDNKLKEKGKKFLSSVKKTISRSPSRTPANRTSQLDPSSASLLTPTRPAHSPSPSVRPSTEVGMPSLHLPEDFNGGSDTQKQDDHAAIAADDSQLAPHAVSVWHSLGLSLPSLHTRPHISCCRIWLTSSMFYPERTTRKARILDRSRPLCKRFCL